MKRRINMENTPQTTEEEKKINTETNTKQEQKTTKESNQTTNPNIPNLDYKDSTNYKILVCIDSKDKNNIKVDTFNDFPGFDEDIPKEKGDPWIPLLQEHKNRYVTEDLLELHYLLKATALVCYRITNYENASLLTDFPKAVMSMLMGEGEKAEAPKEETNK